MQSVRLSGNIGRTHEAKPSFKRTYCGLAITEDDWVTSKRPVDCTRCQKKSPNHHPNRIE